MKSKIQIIKVGEEEMKIEDNAFNKYNQKAE